MEPFLQTGKSPIEETVQIKGFLDGAGQSLEQEGVSPRYWPASFNESASP
jgi:hypothetical protein